MGRAMVLRCPLCAQKLRTPINKGALTLTCTKCRHRWDWEPPMGKSRVVWLIIAVALVGVSAAVYFKSEPPPPVGSTMPKGAAQATLVSQVVPHTSEKTVEDRFAKVLPDSRNAVSAWFGQKGLRVLPQTRGEDEGELKKVGPIFVTKICGANVVAWPSYRFADGGEGVSLTHLTGPADSDLVKMGAVSFDKGCIRVNAAAFPDDGRWHLFCLSAEDPLGTSEDEREVFCLLKATGKDAASGSTDPADLVVRGCIAEGWAGGLDSKWSNDQLRCLVFMVCGQTEMLAREAQGKVGDGLRDKRHAFLLQDLTAATSALDARKQALLQRIPTIP